MSATRAHRSRPSPRQISVSSTIAQSPAPCRARVVTARPRWCSGPGASRSSNVRRPSVVATRTVGTGYGTLYGGVESITLKIAVPDEPGWLWVAVTPVTLWRDPGPPTSENGTLIVMVPDFVYEPDTVCPGG